MGMTGWDYKNRQDRLLNLDERGRLNQGGPARSFEKLDISTMDVSLSSDVYQDSTSAMLVVGAEDIEMRFDGMAMAIVPDNVVDAFDYTRPCYLMVDGNKFTKVESGPDADEGEFVTATNLANLVDSLTDWHGEESAGSVVITSSGFHDRHIDFTIPAVLDIGETGGGDGSGTAATYTVLFAVFDDMNVGDTLDFYGHTFTRADATDTDAFEFVDNAGFAACVSTLDDWTGTVGASDEVVIEAATDSEDFNGYVVILTFRHTTSLVSASGGIPVVAGSSILLADPSDIARFRAIRDGVDSTIAANYYE